MLILVVDGYIPAKSAHKKSIRIEKGAASLSIDGHYGPKSSSSTKVKFVHSKTKPASTSTTSLTSSQPASKPAFKPAKQNVTQAQERDANVKGFQDCVNAILSFPQPDDWTNRTAVQTYLFSILGTITHPHLFTLHSTTLTIDIQPPRTWIKPSGGILPAINQVNFGAFQAVRNLLGYRGTLSSRYVIDSHSAAAWTSLQSALRGASNFSICAVVLAVELPVYKNK